MERYGLLPFALPFLGTAAAAQAPYTLETEGARIMEYLSEWFLPILAGLILLFLLFTILTRVLRKGYRIIEIGATITGGLLAFLFILTGFVFLAAFGALAWGTAVEDISFAGADQWAVPIADAIQYYLSPVIETLFGPEPNPEGLAPFLLAILLIGGAVLILVGFFLLLKLPRGSFYEIIKPGGATTFREVMTRGHEPLAPTVTFKVIDRLTNQPSPDVKVVLKHKEGAKVYTRYTDFNGEVIFQKIDGLYSQYYAFVEGDDERKRYWVIRTAIGAESVT